MIQNQAVGNIPSRSTLMKEIDSLTRRPKEARKLNHSQAEKYPSSHKQPEKVWLFQKCVKCGKMFKIKDSVRTEHMRNPESEEPEMTYLWSFSDYDHLICPECNSSYFQNLNIG